jgi:hypothetical protein
MKMFTKKALGYIVYEGPSELDGSPIVVIINKIKAASKNAKTGALVQSFIIRSDINPVEALKTGDDAAICGHCIHRPSLAAYTGAPPCYVNVGRSVASVYKAYKRGSYTKASPAEVSLYLTGLKLRIGTYGDGAAAPIDVWQQLTQFTSGHVGYSHQWLNPAFDHAQWSKLVMASADTIDEAAQANLFGMRVFRVSVGIDKQQGEVSCPASAESGKKTTCENCMLCAGTSKAAKDIVIADHALGHKKRVISIAKAV